MVLVAFFAVSTANAQFRFGVKGGVSIVNAKFDKDVFKTDNVYGFHIGPSVEGMFGQGGIGMDAALLFSRKGLKSNKLEMRNDFIEVPVNLKIKLGLPLVNPYFAAGPYVAFRVSGDKEIKNIAAGVVDQIKAQSFGAGLNFAAGAELLNRLQVGVAYSVALTDNYKTFDANDVDSYKGKYRTWTVCAALFF
jgi:hypothetical protein